MRREKYSIFVVDGDVGFADELGRRILARSDMDLCGKAYSGDVVLPIVKEKRPDIIIMDLTLPALDGISVIRMLQKELTYRPIIIITSAYSNDMQRYLINDIPNAYFVRKPISFENLLDRNLYRPRPDFMQKQPVRMSRQNVPFIEFCVTTARILHLRGLPVFCMILAFRHTSADMDIFGMQSAW